MRGAADAGHVEHVAVRVARRLEVHVDASPLGEPVGVHDRELRERQLEVARLEAVEPLDRDVQVAALAVPVVQELVRAAVHVAARQHDVAVADQVREHRVDRRHARVEVPGEVLARERPGLDVDDVVRQARRGRVHEPRVDLVQELLPLERVVDPLGAGVQVGRRARDDRGRAEDRGHVVEHRVRAALRGRAALGGERLPGLAQRVLQRVEQLGELEAEEALRVPERDPVAPVQAREPFDRRVPEPVHALVRAVHVAGDLGELAAERARRVEREVRELLAHELVDAPRPWSSCAAATARARWRGRSLISRSS